MGSGLQIGTDGKLRLKDGKLVIGSDTDKCCCASSGNPVFGCYCTSSGGTPTDRFQIAFSGITVTPPTSFIYTCGDLNAVNYTYIAPSFGVMGYQGWGTEGCDPDVNLCCCASLDWEEDHAAALCNPSNPTLPGTSCSINWIANIASDGTASAIASVGCGSPMTGSPYVMFSASRGATPGYVCNSPVTLSNTVHVTAGVSSPGYSGGTVTITPLGGGNADCTLPDVVWNNGCNAVAAGSCTDPPP